MKDAIGFRVSDDFAIGHDNLNTIIFRRNKKPHATSPQFDGSSWRAVRFVYLMKRVIIRDLREFGVRDPEAVPEIAALPDNLIEHRVALARLEERKLGVEARDSPTSAPESLTQPENSSCYPDATKPQEAAE